MSRKVEEMKMSRSSTIQVVKNVVLGMEDHLAVIVVILGKSWAKFRSSKATSSARCSLSASGGHVERFQLPTEHKKDNTCGFFP